MKGEFGNDFRYLREKADLKQKDKQALQIHSHGQCVKGGYLCYIFSFLAFLFLDLAFPPS
jgi:hypothetical protein